MSSRGERASKKALTTAASTGSPGTIRTKRKTRVTIPRMVSAARARRHVEARFSWQAVVGWLEEVYGGKRPVAGA